jgi:ribosomal protein S18 acetylase RimI-like enzyme
VAEDAQPEKLKREKAGTYRTADGRFTVEQTSSGWLLLDSHETNELGLSLTRGPFATLDAARDAIAPARSGPAPKAEIVSIVGRTPRSAAGSKRRGTHDGLRQREVKGQGAREAADQRGPAGDSAAEGREQDSDETRDDAFGAAARKPPGRRASVAARKRPAAPALVIRDLRVADGDQLRKLWTACGFRSAGDDDLALARMARRNPGLLLVASEGTRVVASALGAWDGRRGWIYHVATDETHRRQGIATKLVDQVEAGLRDLGCPKVSVLVRDDNPDAKGFWRARGYDEGSRQFARELRRE